MKSSYILHLFLLLSLNLSAQHNDIRINLGLHCNLPERLFNPALQKHNGKNGGIGVHLCPTWYYSRHLSLGLNMEYAFVVEDYQTDALGGFSIFSFTPGVNYYFTDHDIHPFAGIGAGVYHVMDHEPRFNPGIRPVLGVSYKDLFTLSLEYNRILSNIQIDHKVNGAFDNYYLALKGSLSIGVACTGRP